ncbi:Uncharacterised protein [Chryseobacterium nakagawai]|uniref:Uncharacterized protein n=1 Tax=Chryseobacterium nakagawai TaxID=1241982 RepID=A0AAD0YQ18_CHRNA|nr:hypothetical protein [Chryseobacterium nakagawai]AZA92503.1 hypothetical protein EG343_18795 [Chryseobacterium nakagawai]VEH19082.1 Uncharacterised protein [Chryseobacterium nakagawai]
MKNNFLLLSSLFIGIFSYGQVGIGTTTPDPSSALDIVSTNRGILTPRLVLSTSTQQLNSATNARGLLVYNTGGTNALVEGYYFWNGSEWRTIDNTTAATPSIGSLQCASAILVPGNYIQGTPYSGNLKINYTNGNGAAYQPGNSVTVNGLTFKLLANKLEHGNGELVFSVSGTPTASSPSTTTIPINNTLIPFLNSSMNCSVVVGDVDTAVITQSATIGPLFLNPGEKLGGYDVYHRYVTSPDGKYSVRVKIEKGYAFALADINIRSNTGTPSIMWNFSTDYVTSGLIVYGNNATPFPAQGVWYGNGGGNGTTFSGNTNGMAWGDPDVYYGSPEYRRYTWTSTDSAGDKTLYNFTFMLGAPSPDVAANDTTCPNGVCKNTKAYLRIEQITAPN